jgi:hypothetical protein
MEDKMKMKKEKERKRRLLPDALCRLKGPEIRFAYMTTR